MWSLHDIADAVASSLEQREHAYRQEQAVRGLDALSETAFHPIAADAIAAAGFGVLREQMFPHEWRRKAAAKGSLPERRDRMRCDLVITEKPGQSLDDAVVTQKRLLAERAAVTGTLFESLSPPEPAKNPMLVQPEDALWIEIKVIAQHTLTSGVLGPNRAYSSELTRGPLADLGKLAADERISTGAALVVLFAENQQTARHDLGVLVHKSLDKSLPLISPEMRGFSITDRLGNRWCEVALLGVRRI